MTSESEHASTSESTHQPAYRNRSRPPSERAADLLSRMTVAEKVAQLKMLWGQDVHADPTASTEAPGAITHFNRAGGWGPREAVRRMNAYQRTFVEDSRLGIPTLFSEEVACGVQVDGATVLPGGIGQAATWDPALIQQAGELVRQQLLAMGIRQTLGPVLDIGVDPRWGRIEECYGEDPYLAGVMASAFIRGVQGPRRGGVAAVGKHFVAHGASEGGRHTYGVHMGPQQLREVHGLPFEMGIREADMRGVMATYHDVDRVPVPASRELLTDLLRDEYGLDGVTVSDLNGVSRLHSFFRVVADNQEAAVVALRAGLDVDMPGDAFNELTDAVTSGVLDEPELDRAVESVLRLKFELGIFESPYADETACPETLDAGEERRLARRVAERSIVLLQNKRNLLPLKADQGTIAVIGPNAHRALALVGDYSYPVISTVMQVLATAFDPNTRAAGGLKPEMLPAMKATVSIPTVLEGIRAVTSDVVFAEGCTVTDPSTRGFEQAVAAAKQAAVAVVVVGDQSAIVAGGTVGEFLDSSTCELPGAQRPLIEAVAATGTPVVLVLCNGRPFVLGDLVDHVDAIVEAWFPGEEGAAAIADVLFGAVNPGGKLPVGMLASVGTAPYPYGAPARALLPGMPLYFDGPHEPPFPFGHGLSYTQFDYSGLTIVPDLGTTDGQVAISCDVTNVGDRDGDEVVQLYVRDTIGQVVRPDQELKGFTRLALAAGASARITFRLHSDRLAYFKESAGWIVDAGHYGVSVGSSSRDIRLRGEFHLNGDLRVAGIRRQLITPVSVNTT